jgi:thioredoxin reductase
VFDSPQPARNSASHGVHNFLGLDGLLPSEIRQQAWQQIEVYGSAELRVAHIVDIHRSDANLFTVVSENNHAIVTKQVILAIGYHDLYPDIPGFSACWGKTIIPCPFCDGYENRDRVWGIVPPSEAALDHLPTLASNWTAESKVFLPSHLTLTPQQIELFTTHHVALHYGDITAIEHADGYVEAVTLHTGEQVKVETLIWRQPEAPTDLTQRVIEKFNLSLNEQGYIETDHDHQTAVKGLWAVGDIKGWAGALGAAFAANQAAVAIVREWYT